MSEPSLEDSLGYAFRSQQLLQTALTHPSAVGEHPELTQNNQRLEFLGDAVLQLVLTRELYERHPSAEEGALTLARSRLANRRFLASQARKMNLGQYLILGRGEEAHGGRERPSILADAFEAVLGAVYLDGGLEAGRAFVLRHLGAAIETEDADATIHNPKGALQELLLSRSTETPQYKIEKICGPDHAREFECAVYHGGCQLGRGKGASKKEAECQAARLALESLRHSSS